MPKSARLRAKKLPRKPVHGLKELRRLETWEKGLLWLGLFALPLVVYPDHPDPTTTKMTVALVWIGALLGLAALRLLREGETLSLNRLWLPFGALFAASLLSLVNSVNLWASLLNLALLFGFSVLAWVVAQRVRCREDALWVLGWLLAAGTLAAGYGLLQYFSLVPGHSHPRVRGELMISTFGNKNYLGGYLAYLLIPGLGLLLLASPRWLKLMALGALAVLFAALLGISQDGAWIALIAAGLFTLVGLTWGRLWGLVNNSRSWVAALLGLFVILFLVHSPPNPLNTVLGSGQEAQGASVEEQEPSPEELFSPVTEPFIKESAKIRLFEWSIAWEMFRDQPLVGVGLGNYKLRFLPYKAKLLATERGDALLSSIGDYVAPAAQAHSDYLQWAAETGIAGVLALLFAVSYLAWTGLRGFSGDPEPERRLLRLVVLAGIGTLAVHAVVDFPLHLPASALALSAFLGILCSPHLSAPLKEQSRQQTREHKSPPSVILAALVWIVAVGFLLLGVREFQANTHLSRAMIWGSWGDLEGAQQELEQSLSLSMAPAQNALLLGTIYSLQGRDAQSLPLFRLAVRSRPSELAYLQLGQTLLLLGQREEGQEVLHDLLAMAPRSEVTVEAYRLWDLASLPRAQDLLTVERWLHMGAYAQAGEVIESLLAGDLDPRTRLELWRRKADLARQQGRLTETRTLLKRALEQDPKAEWACLQLAQLAVKEEPSEAEAFLGQARDILAEKRQRVEAELKTTPPSAQRQILRAHLELLRQAESQVSQLQEQLTAHP